MSYFTKYLAENEELIREARQHPIVYLKTGLISILLLMLPFFLMFLLFKWEMIGISMFVILVIVGLLAIFRFILIWQFNVLVITNKRIILIRQNGLFDRSLSEAGWADVREISFRIKGASQTFFRHGDLKITTATPNSKIMVKNVYQPHKLQQFLLKCAKTYSSERS